MSKQNAIAYVSFVLLLLARNLWLLWKLLDSNFAGGTVLGISCAHCEFFSVPLLIVTGPVFVRSFLVIDQLLLEMTEINK